MGLGTDGTRRLRDASACVMAIVGVTLGVGGCSSSTSPRTGSLMVTISAPSGVTPNVTVSGPGGYTKTLGATTTLTGLAAGRYSVTAAPVTIPDAIVATIDTARVFRSPATVAEDTTGVVVTYSVRGGSGGLWVANALAPLAQYTAGQLGTTTSAAAATAFATGQPSGFAFDGNGNVWLILSNGNVVEYTSGQLSSGDSAAPAVTLGATAQVGPSSGGLAFDASGNLWVVNADTSVVEFTVSQLASSGNPTPAVTLSTGLGLGAMAFDASGNLWIATGTATIVEFAVSQLAVSGSPTPSVTLSSKSLSEPLGLAFDARGSLWVADYGATEVFAFTVSQLASTGNPSPAVTLSATSGSLHNPSGLAFDASANLWVANEGDGALGGGSVVEFTASQLGVSGSPTPNVTVTGSSVSTGIPLALAFDPHAANLPLKP